MGLEMKWLVPDMLLQILLDIYTSVWRDMQPVHSGIKGGIFIKIPVFSYEFIDFRKTRQSMAAIYSKKFMFIFYVLNF